MQVLSYQSDVLSHKQQSKRLQEDNQRLQNQMLATGERLEKMTHDNSLDLKKEMLKLQRQLAGNYSFTHTCVLSLVCMVFPSKLEGTIRQPKLWQMTWLASEPQEHMLLFCSMQSQPNLVSYACASYSMNLVKTLCTVGFEVRFGFVLITTQYLLAGLTILTNSHQFPSCSCS